MSLTSLYYIAFLVCVIGVYYLVPSKYRWIAILAANIFFYATSGAIYLLYVLLASGTTFCGALFMEEINNKSKAELSQLDNAEEKRTVRQKYITLKKRATLVAVLLVIGTWATIKYGNFVIENINRLFDSIHIDYTIGKLNLVLPLGMSFYSFQAIGYMIDVYRSKYPAQRNFFKYLTFITYFPHIMQGPFSRYDVLGKSILESHDFSYDRMCQGAARILWGFFKKIVIADQIGISVDRIFDNYTNYTGLNILCVVFMYAIQIYADFSGYMDIVCGFSRILGIDLQENFNQPYFAKSIDEFWRRWHMTLSQWFRDYMFYPVSMSKSAQRIGKKARGVLGNKWGRLLPSYFALIFVWTCTGLWHGANWTYLIWGYLNFIVIVLGMHWADYYRKAREILHIREGNLVWEGFRIIRTFALVAFFRFFSVADSVSIAFGMIRRIFTNFDMMKVVSNPSNLFPGLEKVQIVILGICTIVLIIVDVFREHGKWEDVKTNTKPLIRAIVFALMLITIFYVVPAIGEVNSGEFLYANF